jgi:hypothetical protein
VTGKLEAGGMNPETSGPAATDRNAVLTHRFLFMAIAGDYSTCIAAQPGLCAALAERSIAPRSGPIRSIGSGKTMVELLSVAMSVSVCR